MSARRHHCSPPEVPTVNQHRLSDYAGKLVVLGMDQPGLPVHRHEVQERRHASIAEVRSLAAHRVAFHRYRRARQGGLSDAAAAARAHCGNPRARSLPSCSTSTASIARSYGAKTTPSFFLIDRDGKLAYEGAMNDQVFATIALRRRLHPPRAG